MKKKLKLIILTGSCPISALGGAGRVINSYINHYKNNSHEYIFLPIHTRKGNRIFRIKPLFVSFFKAIWIRFKLRDHKLVIHHHHTTIYDLFAFLLLKLITGISRNDSLITFHNPKYFEIISSLRKSRVTLNQNSSKFMKAIKINFLKLYFKSTNRLFKNLHFLNSINYESVRNLINLEAKILIKQNPLSEKQYTILKENMKKSNKELGKNKIIGTFSLMRKGKRLDRAIKMMLKLPKDYSLLIGGKGPEEDSLRKLVKKLNLESRIQFLGWMDEVLKEKFFKSINIFLITSDADTQSLVFLEAITNRIPVISVPNPVFKEIYPEGICANYAKDFNPSSLAEEIILYEEKKLFSLNSSKFFLNKQESYFFAETLFN